VTDFVSDHELPEHYKSGHFLGHPKGLYMLFFAEMWERFSYYGMRALLILYLTKHFLYSDDTAQFIYASYGSLVYMVPIIGGIIADRYLGARKAVAFGAILLVVGHIGMAIEGAPAVQDGSIIIRSETHVQILFLSMAFIVAGVGFLKANISTMVGKLYAEGDPARDSGFTIFYMGINLGAFVSAMLCGYLGETFGWRYGFGLAGLGMLSGLVVFVRWKDLLEGHGEPPDPEKLKEPLLKVFNREILIYLFGIFMVFAAWWLLQNRLIIGSLLSLAGILAALGVLGYAFFKCDREARDKLLVASVLILSSVLFWALFEQSGSSVNLMTDRVVDRDLFGWTVPASMFQSMNAGFIIVLAPVFAWIWIKLSRCGLEPNTPVKFSLGLLQVGLGFLVLVAGIKASGDGNISMWAIVAFYLLHTTGELCLSPVGLSAITKLSPIRVVGMMMGVWFLASAGASFIAGLIASMTSAETHGGEIVDMTAAKLTYIDVYTQVGWYAVAAAAIMFVLSFILKKGMHGVH
jgi:proton-dependent oligopeptide transporter, POT family